MPVAASLREAVTTAMAHTTQNPGTEVHIYRDDVSGTILIAHSDNAADVAGIAKCVKARHLCTITFKVDNEERSFIIYEPRADFAISFNPVEAEQVAEAFA